MRLSRYVAFLRSLYLLYQNAHWQCQGPNFYALHLMFERLYQAVHLDTDEAAEKTAGLTNSKVLDLAEQIKYFQSILADIGKFDNFLQAGLAGELEFQKLIKSLIIEMKEQDKLDPGLDDMLMHHFSNSQNRIYLLKQSLAQ